MVVVCDKDWEREMAKGALSAVAGRLKWVSGSSSFTLSLRPVTITGSLAFASDLISWGKLLTGVNADVGIREWPVSDFGCSCTCGTCGSCCDVSGAAFVWFDMLYSYLCEYYIICRLM